MSSSCIYSQVPYSQMKMFESYFSRDSRHGVFEDISSQVTRIDIRQWQQVQVYVFKTYSSMFLKISQLEKPVKFTASLFSNAVLQHVHHLLLLLWLINWIRRNSILPSENKVYCINQICLKDEKMREKQWPVWPHE